MSSWAIYGNERMRGPIVAAAGGTTVVLRQAIAAGPGGPIYMNETRIAQSVNSGPVFMNET